MRAWTRHSSPGSNHSEVVKLLPQLLVAHHEGVADRDGVDRVVEDVAGLEVHESRR